MLKAKILTIAPFALVLPLLFMLVTGHAEPTADDLARQARELRIQAMKGHCSIIGQKIAQCYAGDRKVCDSMQESLAWFTSEYGQTPELACQSEDPLTFGDGQK